MKIKKIIAGVVAVAMVFSFAACGKNKGDTSTSETTKVVKRLPSKFTVLEPVNMDTEVNEELGLVPKTNMYTVAKAFIQSLATNQFATARDLLAIEGSPFVTEADVKFAYPRSSFSEISNLAGKEVSLKIKENETKKEVDSAMVSLDIVDESGDKEGNLLTYEVHLKLDKNNEWHVDCTDFYLTDVPIKVPQNTEISIDGNQVIDTNKTVLTTEDEICDIYTVRYIGKTDKKITVKCDNYEISKIFTPIIPEKNKPLEIEIKADNETTVAATIALEGLWNAMYKDYQNKIIPSDYAKYFSEKSTVESYTGMASLFDKLAYSNFSTEPKTFVAKSFRAKDNGVYLSDKIIKISFTYQLEKTYTEDKKVEYVERESKILLEKIGDTYKIYQILDKNLFSNAS